MAHLPQHVTRRTTEYDLAQWNQAFRQSPLYQTFMQRYGLPTDGRVRLSRGQQAALERELQAAGFQMQGGMHIDQGGNLNQKNRTGKIAIAAGATTVTLFGVPGLFPGLLTAGGGGTSAAGAAGGVLPSKSLPVASLMGGPPAVISQNVSRNVPFGTGPFGPNPQSRPNTNWPGRGNTTNGPNGPNDFLNWFKDPTNLIPLGAILAQLGFSKGNRPPSLTAQIPELRNLVKMNEARTRRVDPLHEAVAQMAFQQLPTYGRQGIDMQRVPLPPSGL